MKAGGWQIRPFAHCVYTAVHPGGPFNGRSEDFQYAAGDGFAKLGMLFRFQMDAIGRT